MSRKNARHVSTNVPSTRTTIRSAVSAISRPTISPFSHASQIEFVDYSAIDWSRKEKIQREQEVHRAWTAKFDPWLIDEYRQMYNNIAKVYGISRETPTISLKRSEWQQPTNVIPPLHKRLTGQRRRRLLGAFPETENDKIGWRVLPQQALEIYGRAKSASVYPLSKQNKFSNWPIQSFY